ncbi:MAG: SRPBCC family protein [Chthoniobacterales bacterium]
MAGGNAHFYVHRLAFISLLLLFSVQLGAADNATAAKWKEESNRDGLIIYSRARAGSALKEFKTVGMIDATSSVVFAVLADVEAYPSFMPYTSECSVLTRTGDCTVAYQRLELPLVSDRDYTLRSEDFKTTGPNGPIYRIQWEPANNLGPSEKPGVERVKICEGGWLIEPDGAGGTRATYRIYTDGGGGIPALIANTGSRMAIRKMFAAIRKEVREPKYAVAKG